MRFVTFPLIVALGLVSGCVQPARAPQIVPAQRPTVATPAPTSVLPEPADPPVLPGIWTYETDARGSRALFGLANADAVLVIRCDRAGNRIFVSIPGNDPATMMLRAATTSKGFTALPTGTTPVYLTAEIGPTDSILDALAFSRGRFTIAVGARDIVVPAWPEFSRVIEDCRG